MRKSGSDDEHQQVGHEMGAFSGIEGVIAPIAASEDPGK